MSRPLGIPSYRLRYLSRLRFYLRGEAPEAIEDIIEQMNVAIEDMVDDDPAVSNVHPSLDLIESVRAGFQLAVARRRGGRKRSIQSVPACDQSIRALCDQNAERLRIERAYALLPIERRVVDGLLPPDQMARSFRAALTRRKFTESDALWLDAFTIAFGVALYLSPAKGVLAPWQQGLLAVSPIAVGIASAVIRRFPVGALTRSMYHALAPLRVLSIAVAAVTGFVGAAGMVVDLHLAYHAHAWSMDAHFANIPGHVVAMICAALLGMQPRRLQRHAHALKRCLSLEVYRNDRYGHLAADDQARARALGYFTEETW